MGQIFYACAYDIENKIRCVYETDKFHANCYSYSEAVLSMHYLLRQKPYHIMWGGEYMSIDDSLESVSRKEDLLGISTYLTYSDFKENNTDIEKKSYYDKVKFIAENNDLWNKIDIWDETDKYFDWKNTRSVKYSGFLLNHTKKLAIDLVDYYEQSKFLNDSGSISMCIDAVPVLAETGGGTVIALYDGVFIDSTEELAGKWCGDLLQIVEELPQNYTLINCCFSEFQCKAKYCYSTFGTNEDGYILSNKNGKLYQGSALDLFSERDGLYNVKVEKDKNKTTFIPIKL